MMRWIKKTAAAILLLIGLPVCALTAIEILNPNTPSDEREDSVAALIILGLPPAVLGGLLVLNLRQDHKAKTVQSDRELEQLFLEEIQASNGVINPIFFATRADISLDAAKAYLDQKAVQLNGLYEATDTGGVIYRFPL